MHSPKIHQLMHQAALRAQESPDKSTQNGVALWTPEGVFTACNRFPVAVKETEDRWERPTKYSYVEHAERNSIYAAALRGASTADSVMVAIWAACADCARAIIQSGVQLLIRYPAPENARWDESIAVGDGMMAEAGIEVVEYEPEGAFGITLLREGKPFYV